MKNLSGMIHSSRSSAGEHIVLDQTPLSKWYLPEGVSRSLNEEEMAAYRAPYAAAADVDLALTGLCRRRTRRCDFRSFEHIRKGLAKGRFRNCSSPPNPERLSHGGQRKPAVLRDLEKPAGSDRQRTALRAGGLARRNWRGAPAVRSGDALLADTAAYLEVIGHPRKQTTPCLTNTGSRATRCFALELVDHVYSNE